MGNMCLDLCKEITTNDKKARLTKEIKDIHPIDDGSLLKISYSNGSVFYSKLTNGSLLRETSRLNGEVRYTKCGDHDNNDRNDNSIDEDTISELNDLIREVSGGEDTHNSTADDTIMTRSSTSLEITNLLASLENNKILHLERTSGAEEEETLLYVQSQRCSTPKESWHQPKRNSSPCVESHIRSGSRLGYHRISDCNNNIEPEEEITYLLNRLSRENRASGICSQENLFRNFDKNGDDTFDSEELFTTTDTTCATTTTQDESSYSDSSRLLNTTTETSFSEEIVITKITTPEPIPPMHKVIERKPPDRDPSVTVIDAYLENIDENFTKEDEINYLLSLLKGEDEPFDKESEDGDKKEEIDTKQGENVDKSDKTIVEELPTQGEPKIETPKKKQIVRKISPVFSMHNDVIVPARKSRNTYKENDTNSNKENMDAINAMDFLCQLICSTKAPPLLSKPTRPCPPSPKSAEIKNLLTELEKNPKSQNSEDTMKKTPIDHSLPNTKQNEKTSVSSPIKTKTNDSDIPNYVNIDSITSSTPNQCNRVKKTSITDEDDYLSEEAELSSMMSTITETSDDLDDLESLQDLSTEVEIESLLSKLGSVQLVANDSVKDGTANHHRDLNSLINDLSDSTYEHVLSENHSLTPCTNTNVSEKADISDLFSFLDNAKKAYAAADKRDSSAPTSSKPKCNGHTDDDKENNNPKHEPKNGIVTQEVDLSEISVTYRHIKKSILLNEEEFSEETKSIKNELHFYTRGLTCRSLSPCYERDETNELNITNGSDSLSLEQLIEQLASFQGCVTR